MNPSVGTDALALLMPIYGWALKRLPANGEHRDYSVALCRLVAFCKTRGGDLRALCNTMPNFAVGGFPGLRSNKFELNNLGRTIDSRWKIRTADSGAHH